MSRSTSHAGNRFAPNSMRTFFIGVVGTLAKAHFGDAMYSVGLFMYRGESRGNDGSVIPVVQPSANSLESALYCTRRRAAIVELKGDEQEPGTAWFRTWISDLSWGSLREHMVPNAQFDAILFVDTVHPAVYLDPR